MFSLFACMFCDNKLGGERVALDRLGPLYESLGVSVEDFVRWHDKYGFDTRGSSWNNDELFIPDYPVFGKLMDIDIDPVILPPEECAALAGECQRALMKATSPAARTQLCELIALAAAAAEKQGALWFGGS